jgi:hypothetical protein
MQNLSIISTNTKNLPRKNFGSKWNVCDTEDQFALSFTEEYNRKYNSVHSGSPKLNRILAREVPMSRFGIADLVTVSWDPYFKGFPFSDSQPPPRTTIRAFEFKLSNWRKGLMQAYRYSFFADASVLVLPSSKISVAKQFLGTFVRLNIGLWGFNEVTHSIYMLFTPRPRYPANKSHRDKVLENVIDMAKWSLKSS